MIGRRPWQHQAEKLAQRKRIDRPPRNRALGIQAFEIPDQQEVEVAARWWSGAALVRIKSFAQAFDVPVRRASTNVPFTRFDRLVGRRLARRNRVA